MEITDKKEPWRKRGEYPLPSKNREEAKAWEELESNSEMQGGLVTAGKGASSQQRGLNPGSQLKARLMQLE